MNERRWMSADKKWRVTVIPALQIMRVETRGLKGWIWRADTRNPKEVARFVPLKELEEIPI